MAEYIMRVKRGLLVRGIRMHVGGKFVWGKIVQIDVEGDEE